MIFAILGLGRNLLLTLLLGILFFLCYVTLVAPSVLSIIMPLFAVFLMFSYASFLVNFAAYPLVDKYMVQPYLKNQKKQSPDQNGEEGTSSKNL